MKRHIKNIAGVTLLEIMLVLAVASMVIVMSIRYYQNAQNSENTNIILEEIQNIGAAADNLAQGASTYSAASQASVTAIAGSTNMVTPYAGTITITGATTSYSVTVPNIPNGVCTSLAAKLAANSKFSTHSCTGSGASTSLVYTYVSNS
jgi:type II secretory pathway pseudopilin PulG